MENHLVASHGEKQQGSPDEHHTLDVLSGASGGSSPTALFFLVVMISFSPGLAQTLYWLFSSSDTVSTYWGSGAVCWLVVELCPWTLLGPSLDLLSLGALCA